jgi:hypothetical protein
VSRFGDAGKGKDLGVRLEVEFGSAPFGVAKFCPSTVGYKPLPFAVADQIDYSKNQSASIFYWRPSTKVCDNFYQSSKILFAKFSTRSKFKVLEF